MRAKVVKDIFYLDMIITSNIKVFVNYLMNKNNLGSDVYNGKFKRAITMLGVASADLCITTAMENPRVTIKNDAKVAEGACLRLLTRIDDIIKSTKNIEGNKEKLLSHNSLRTLPEEFTTFIMSTIVTIHYFSVMLKEQIDGSSIKKLETLQKRIRTVEKELIDLKILWYEGDDE